MMYFLLSQLVLVGRSLFADDGVLWKRGRNLDHLLSKAQEAANHVVEWGYDWGFRFSVEKTKSVFFTRRTVSKNLKLQIYGQEIERVSSFKFLGVMFDSRLTWGDEIDRVEARCKKVINVMRCLAGGEWGASCLALKRLYQAWVWVCSLWISSSFFAEKVRCNSSTGSKIVLWCF